MNFGSDQEQRNDAVYAEHKAALARGEKRVLCRTKTGELHSYPADEIGFPRAVDTCRSKPGGVWES